MVHGFDFGASPNRRDITQSHLLLVVNSSVNGFIYYYCGSSRTRYEVFDIIINDIIIHVMTSLKVSLYTFFQSKVIPVRRKRLAESGGGARGGARSDAVENLENEADGGRGRRIIAVKYFQCVCQT